MSCDALHIGQKSHCMVIEEDYVAAIALQWTAHSTLETYTKQEFTGWKETMEEARKHTGKEEQQGGKFKGSFSARKKKKTENSDSQGETRPPLISTSSWIELSLYVSKLRELFVLSRMKSKPPCKKLKMDSSGAEMNGSSRAETFDPAVIATVKASMAATATEIVTNAKIQLSSGDSCIKKESALSSSTKNSSAHETSNFPLLSIHDLSNAKEFPRIVNCLAHPHTNNYDITNPKAREVISVEDVDQLQQELEILWSDASVRLRILQKEQESLFGASEKLCQSTGTTNNKSCEARLVAKSSTGLSPLLISTSPKSGPSHSRASDVGAHKKSVVNGKDSSLVKLEKTPKKLKNDMDNKNKRSTEKGGRGIHRGSSLHHADEFTPVSFRHAPNQFWEFANTYCRELSDEDLDTLAKIIEEQKLPADIFHIPGLGPHFKDTTSLCSIRHGRDRIETRSQDVCGPLTQRLVAALVDSRIAAYKRGDSMGDLYGNTSNGLFLNRSDLLTSLGLTEERRGSPQLERRLRQILSEQGLLIGEEGDAHGDDLRDEILADIKKTQNHLLQLHQHNSERLTQLYSFTKKELGQRGPKQDLERADKELIDAYRIVSAARSKRKPLSKREREVAVRALENRKMTLGKLYRTETEPDPENSREVDSSVSEFS